MIDQKPWGEINYPNIEGADVCIMGIPFDGAVSCGKGTALAPEVIRSLSRYLPPATEEGFFFSNLKIYDHADVAVDLDWPRYYATVEKQAYKLFSSGAFCLFLGGDHSVTIPLQKAFARYYKDKKIGVIHFDSHLDMNYEYDGHKWSHACTERRAVENLIGPEDLALVGIRSWEKDERKFFDENPGILLISARDIFFKGCKNVCKIIEKRFSSYDAVYLTFDVDVLDPSIAPGTGTPELGGITGREALEMIRYLMQEVPIKAMDVVEVSPPLDSINNITTWAVLKVIYEVFGVLSS